VKRSTSPSVPRRSILSAAERGARHPLSGRVRGARHRGARHPVSSLPAYGQVQDAKPSIRAGIRGHTNRSSIRHVALTLHPGSPNRQPAKCGHSESLLNFLSDPTNPGCLALLAGWVMV
jgi:hypothetical protein